MPVEARVRTVERRPVAHTVDLNSSSRRLPLHPAREAGLARPVETPEAVWADRSPTQRRRQYTRWADRNSSSSVRRLGRRVRRAEASLGWTLLAILVWAVWATAWVISLSFSIRKAGRRAWVVRVVLCLVFDLLCT